MRPARAELAVLARGSDGSADDGSCGLGRSAAVTSAGVPSFRSRNEAEFPVKQAVKNLLQWCELSPADTTLLLPVDEFKRVIPWSFTFSSRKIARGLSHERLEIYKHRDLYFIIKQSPPVIAS